MQAGEPVDLIDVRTPREYRRGMCQVARLLPLDKVSKEAVLAEGNGSRIGHCMSSVSPAAIAHCLFSAHRTGPGQCGQRGGRDGGVEAGRLAC